MMMKFVIILVAILKFNLLLGLSTSNNNETTIVAQTTIQPNKEFDLEFDESDISRLNLKIKWTLDSNKIKSPNRFVLLMEQKRLNLTSFLFDYSSPQLIDDESTIESSTMSPTRFKFRMPLTQQSNIDCAMNCINSTKFSISNESFECNIFYYEPHSRICVLYQYDFNENSTEQSANSIEPEWSFQNDNIYDYFIDECEIDEILGDVIGFSRYCRRLLDFKQNHIVKINPYIDYRFSLSLRDGTRWTSTLRREYQYAPKITIEVKGELKLGKNVTIECKTDLHSSIIDSISWKNGNPLMKGVLKLTPLTVYNMYQTYFCEIRYNFVRMMQKAFKLNITDFGETKPKLEIAYVVDVENLNIKITWNVTSLQGNLFRPERLILLYSENNSKSYKFVNKYLLFELSNFDNTKFSSLQTRDEIYTSTEDECAIACLQRNYCEHFAFYKSLEPINSNTKTTKRKNCILAANTNDNIIICRLDSICANLLPFDNHIQNNTFSISILPNTVYKFKLQLKDKFLNWTNEQETELISIPISITLEQSGSLILNNNDNNKKNNYELICNTKVNKQLNLEIIWSKDGKELAIDDPLYLTKTNMNSNYLNSILEFRNLSISKKDNYSGIYKCKFYNRIADIGHATYYDSEPVNVQFSYLSPMKYNVTQSNITLPTIPGLLLELSCIVTGNPEPNIKWLIDGVNYSIKKFEFLTDEPFVINITYRNSTQINHILVMKTDNPRNLSKYECILNDNITIRQHYIKVIDEKPQLDVQIDKSLMNKLKLQFKIKVKNQNQDILNSINIKPLKFSILYVENTTFSYAFQTIIAPETLSKTESKTKTNLTDRLPIATLKHTLHGILSCKLLCFNTPFCKSYEHLAYDDSCNLYSTSEVESYYEKLIDDLKKKSNSTFNLIHLLRGNILSLVQEDPSLNNKILIEKKSYPECEPKPAKLLFTEEIRCNDELNDFKDTYVFENLSPATSYQFKVEVANAFGKSSSVITDQIEVPFKLNPIVEKTENNSSVSLICSTPIIETKNLRFYWFKNEQLISNNSNSEFEQVLHQPFDDSKNSYFASELKFKINPLRRLNGFYTCSLVFSEDFYSITKNESLIFRPNYGPLFTYNKTLASKNVGDIFTESCTTEGWPLPTIDWYFNGKPISNLSSYNQPKSQYTIVNHHRHLTINSHLLISNLTQNLSGIYTCIINGKINAKNSTLLVNPDNSNQQKDNAETNESKNESRKNKSYLKNILIPILLTSLVCTAFGFIAFSYYKKTRSNSNTSFSYNHIEEETMSGVDNFTLLDDSQIDSDQNTRA